MKLYKRFIHMHATVTKTKKRKKKNSPACSLGKGNNGGTLVI